MLTVIMTVMMTMMVTVMMTVITRTMIARTTLMLRMKIRMPFQQSSPLQKVAMQTNMVQLQDQQKLIWSGL